MLQRSYAAEPILALACTLDGAYCAGGGPSGTVHLWEVGSGRLLRSWPAHYKVRITSVSPSSLCRCPCCAPASRNWTADPCSALVPALRLSCMPSSCSGWHLTSGKLLTALAAVLPCFATLTTSGKCCNPERPPRCSHCTSPTLRRLSSSTIDPAMLIPPAWPHRQQRVAVMHQAQGCRVRSSLLPEPTSTNLRAVSMRLHRR